MGAVGGGGRKMSIVGSGTTMGMVADEKSLTMGMTDKEIDERVSFPRVFVVPLTQGTNCYCVTRRSRELWKWK